MTNIHTATFTLIAVAVVAVVIGYLRTPEPAEVNLQQTYSSDTMKFSLRLPDGYTIDESYIYKEIGQGEEIPGVRFTIPLSMATGTNLSSDSYISVEQIPGLQSCIAGPFIWQGQRIVFPPGADLSEFSMASSTGAAAGKRYENAVYVQKDTDPCIAVRYFIRFESIGNYPPGTVREFDEQALLTEFNAIRRSLEVTQ